MRACLLLGLLAGVLRADDPPPLRALDPANLDRSVDPCVDPWRFANGGWLDRHAPPPDEAAFSAAHEVQERNQLILRALLEEAAARADAPRGSDDQLLGAFWCACMDTDAIEQQGLAPISDLLGRVAAIADPDDLRFVLVFATLQDVPLLFDLRAERAVDDATDLLPWLWQAGLGLPDAGAYSRDGERSQALRADYVAHVAALLAAAGQTRESAAADAALVMEVETTLAAHSSSGAELLEPRAVWNPFTLEEADAECPGLRWSELLTRLGLGREPRIVLAQPDYFRVLAGLIESLPVETWRAYLRWRVVDLGAPLLGRAFADEHFRFHGRALAGAQAPPPRWKTCLRAADAALGMTLGRAFVARAFSPEAAGRAARLVEGVRAALRARLAAAAWLGEESRRAALEKLDALAVKIGAPATSRDDRALVLGRQTHAANVQAAAEHARRHEIVRLLRPVDRQEWLVPPQTVDALYDPRRNEIVLPAGLLQPPFFTGTDEAADHGALGAIVGHEITHGFDDEGASLDASGNPCAGWTAPELAEFRRRGAELAQAFDASVAIDELHVDGTLTLRENIADLGGLRLAFDAFRATPAGQDRSPDASGLLPDQRFFLAYLQAWRTVVRPEALRLMLRTDPHAPARLRATLPLQNMPEFGAAFGCAAGSAFVPARRLEIW